MPRTRSHKHVVCEKCWILPTLFGTQVATQLLAKYRVLRGPILSTNLDQIHPEVENNQLYVKFATVTVALNIILLVCIGLII